MKNQNVCIFLKSNFITNFKPNSLVNFNSFSNFKKNRQIYCKNFFMYILLIKYKNNSCVKSSLFIKKQKRKVYTILRSPYRHKLARHQLNINRYSIQNTIKIDLNNYIFFKNWKNIVNFLDFTKNTNNFFESNLIYTNNICVSIPFIFENNFLLKNFLNNNNK